MTAENNGTGAPQDDDPFAYLYRPEGGGTDGGAAPGPQQPGVPRRSYNQVRAVGERQYGGGQSYGGQQSFAGGAGAGQQQAPPVPQQPGAPGAYGGIPGQAQGPGGPPHSAHYAAPETMPGGRAALRQQGGGAGGAGGHGGRGRGGNRNGLLIGAVAVVAAVVLGIGAAMLFNDGSTAKAGSADSTPTAGKDAGQGQQSDKPDDGKQADKDKDEPKSKMPPKEDAAALRLEGGAKIDKTIPGAEGKDGGYVAGMNAPGATAAWTADLPKAGTYNLYVRYGVPGDDMHLSLGVNGKPHATGLKMSNFAGAEKGDWEKGWTYTYSTVEVDEGSNTFAISCGDGDKCDVNLDQVWLKRAG